MNTPRRTTSVLIALALLGHAFLWGLLLATLVFAVPRFERQFADFNLQLPTLTKLILEVSHWGPLLFLAFLLLLVADGILLVLMVRRRLSVLVGIWVFLMSILPLLLLGVTWGLLYLHLTTFLEGLSR